MDKYQLCFLGSLLIASESVSLDPSVNGAELAAFIETLEAPATLWVDDEVEWNEAKDRCAAGGGWLWAPKYRDELAYTNYQNYWTGWSNLKQSGVFTDTQGNQLSVDSDAWLPGEPNDRLRTDESLCVEKLRAEQTGFNDTACKHKRKFYCEIPKYNEERVWSNVEKTWQDAKDDCEARGGWLWAPTAEEVVGESKFWTGWSNLKQKGLFTDTQGNQLSIDSGSWLPGEPNHGLRTDDKICVECLRQLIFGLNDKNCKDKRKFYCEIPNLSYHRVLVLSERYRWNDARSYCKAAKGWLWAPKNEEELGLGTSREYWTGWNDRDLEGTFMDMKNNTLRSDDSVWDDREPNYHNEKDCVKSKDMRLNDEDCDKKLSFYCDIPVTKIATSKGTPTTTTTAITSIAALQDTTTRPNNATPTTTVPEKDKHSGANQGGGKVEAEVTEATATQVGKTLLTAAGVLVFASAL